MTVYMIVPCGGAKLPHGAAARNLYTGSAFRHVLASVEVEAAATARDLGVEVRVLILSALHGLVELDTEVAPYDVTMTDRGSITVEGLTETAATAGITYGDEVFGFLPNAYRVRLESALDVLDVVVQDVYEAAPGIGYQRGVASSLNRYNADAA